MNKGFIPIIVLLLVGLVIGLLIVILAKSSFLQLTKQTSLTETFEKIQENKSNIKPPSWEFDYNTKTWSVTGTPPKCPEPLVFPSPVDVNLASGVLYPGQERSGDYKPHGGFRFDGLANNEVDVYAPMDGKLVEASRHLASGEVQYVLYVINDCGIMYKLDHLREVTQKFNEIFDNIPMGAEGDSRTTRVAPPVFVAKGEHVATKVGIESTKNVFMDFGVYDLRNTNGVDYGFHDYYNINQYGTHALCWLDFLEESDKNLVRSLPAADFQNGSTSDYCKQ